MLISPLTEVNTRELTDRALSRISSLSNGKLSGFTEHSTTRVLVEGLVSVVNELVHQVALVPQATLIELLNSTGFEPSQGSKAKGLVTISLTSTPVDPLTFPEGLKLSTPDGFIFATTEPLTIAGTSGDVAVEAIEVGSGYNVPTGSISVLVPGQGPFLLLSQIRNDDPTTGGTDALEPAQALEQGYRQLYAGRVLITARDYTQFVLQQLPGAVVRVKGVTGPNNEYELGGVHVYLLNPDNTAPSSAQLTELEQVLQDRIVIGTNVYVSSLELMNIDVDVYCVTDGSLDTDELRHAIANYLNPRTFSTDQVYYRELEYVVRSTPGVTRVDSLLIAHPPALTDANDIPLPNSYTLPILRNLRLFLDTPTGLLQLTFFAP